jgi:hypothetical protein
MAGLHHRTAEYQRRSRAIRAQAKACPSTRCWRCGLTLAQIRRIKPWAEWTAGHHIHGQVGGAMSAECSPCNFSDGAHYGNDLRRRGIDPGAPPPTVRW